jgi:hypothetical protein
MLSQTLQGSAVAGYDASQGLLEGGVKDMLRTNQNALLGVLYLN